MPQVKVKTILLYTFDELPTDKAREAARDWYRSLIEASEIGEGPIGTFRDICTHLGITLDTHAIPLCGGGTRQEPIVYWTLHQQGAGASFSGRWAHTAGGAAKLKADFTQDEKLHAIADVLEAAAGYSARITSRDVWRNEIDVYDADGNEIAIGEDPRPAIAQAFADLRRWLYEAIDAEYDWLHGAEHIDETLKANEYTFTAAGEREDL